MAGGVKERLEENRKLIQTRINANRKLLAMDKANLEDCRDKVIYLENRIHKLEVTMDEHVEDLATVNGHLQEVENEEHS